MSIEKTESTRFKIAHFVETYFAFGVVFLLALFPILARIARLFQVGIPGSSQYVSHLVIWITFIGGMITSRTNEHLAFSVGHELFKGKWRILQKSWIAFVGAAMTTAFAISSFSFIMRGFDPAEMVGVVPVRIATIILPVGYLVMAVRFVTSAEIPKWTKAVASLGFLLGITIAIPPLLELGYQYLSEPPLFFDTWYENYYLTAEKLFWPGFILLICSGFLGLPLFVVLGGTALLLIGGSWGSLEVMGAEAYSMLIDSNMPAIPLFTFVGFILSDSNAGKRLVRIFNALFGWLPGGIVFVAVVVCAFFTTFTGASGVTILALGALLHFVLSEKGFPDRFSTGLLTSSGSIGLLFFPSLPIIIYAVVAQVSIIDMFKGGIVPGVIMVFALAGAGAVVAIKRKIPRVKFNGKEALAAFKSAGFDLLLPVIIMFGLFTRFLGGLIETAAIAILYSIIVQVFIYKDISLKDLPKTIRKGIPIIGGILVILAASQGLKHYIVDSMIPDALTQWVSAHIESKYVFLLLLNLALLVTGCLMDIFSAINVVVPLILPLGAHFGIHPVHLGIIFLANLELGYLTPPVGMNLFLSSYRFKKPLSQVYRSVIFFFIILLISVLFITYVPGISTFLLPK